MPARSVVETTYEDPRTGRRWKEVRVEEVPDNRIDFIRQRELASFYGEPAKSLVLHRDNEQDENDEKEDAYYANRQMIRNPRFADDTYLGKNRTTDGNQQRSRKRQDEGDGYLSPRNGSGVRRARSERRSMGGGNNDQGQSQSQYGNQSQSQSQKQNQDQTQNRNQRQSQCQGRSQNQNGNQSQGQGQNGQNQGQDQNGQNQEQGENRDVTHRVPMNKDRLDEFGQKGGQLKYSMKDHSQNNFVERHFDSSWDGLLAATAGGIVGVMGVRRLVLPVGKTEEENKANAKKNRAKTIAGGVAGALAVNAAENWFRVYTEENAERSEDMKTAMEFCGEACEGLM